MRKIAVLSVVLVSLVGCGKSLSKADIEKKIETMLKEKGIEGKATCPQAAKPNTHFECTVQEKGVTETVIFKIDADDSNVQMNLQGAIIEPTAILPQIKAKAPTADIKCPFKARALGKGQKVTCDLSGVDGMTKLEITSTDEKANIEFKALP